MVRACGQSGAERVAQDVVDEPAACEHLASSESLANSGKDEDGRVPAVGYLHTYGLPEEEAAESERLLRELATARGLRLLGVVCDEAPYPTLGVPELLERLRETGAQRVAVLSVAAFAETPLLQNMCLDWLAADASAQVVELAAGDVG